MGADTLRSKDVLVEGVVVSICIIWLSKSSICLGILVEKSSLTSSSLLAGEQGHIGADVGSAIW